MSTNQDRLKGFEMIALRDTASVRCDHCEKVHTFGYSAQGFALWKNGELIQNALPELSAEERELLISRTCGDCWDEMFPEDSED